MAQFALLYCIIFSSHPLCPGVFLITLFLVRIWGGWLDRFTEIKTFYSVTIATRLWTGMFPGWYKNCSLFHNVQTGIGAHPASHQMVCGDFSPVPDDQVLRLTLTLVPRPRMRRAASSLSLFVFKTWCVIKERNNFAIRLWTGEPKIPWNLWPT
jgi:hypothetical protein